MSSRVSLGLKRDIRSARTRHSSYAATASDICCWRASGFDPKDDSICLRRASAALKRDFRLWSDIALRFAGERMKLNKAMEGSSDLSVEKGGTAPSHVRSRFIFTEALHDAGTVRVPSSEQALLVKHT